VNKYERVLAALERGEDATMKVFGQSMMPIIKSGSKLTFRRTNDYEVGDVVISRVRSRIIDAHKITKIDADGRYLISNNKCWDNGWTRKIFGRVIAIEGEPFGRPSTTIDADVKAKSGT